jgi:hypothetical protein
MRARSILPLLLGCALATAARAEEKCAKEGIQLFPAPGSVIPTNVKFILEGLGSEQSRVLDLLGKELFLIADDDKVTLKVQRGWKSAMNRTAVVLRPRAILKPNRIYRVALDERLPRFKVIGVAQPYELPAWRSGKGPDDRAPKWVSRPAVSEGEHRLEEGQLIRNVKLRMTMQDESPAYLLLALRRMRGSTAVQTYFVPIQGGQAVAGHDACSGSFTFEDGLAYRATVECYDAAGNAAPKVNPIEFNAPRPVVPR